MVDFRYLYSLLNQAYFLRICRGSLYYLVFRLNMLLLALLPSTVILGLDTNIDLIELKKITALAALLPEMATVSMLL